MQPLHVDDRAQKLTQFLTETWEHLTPGQRLDHIRFALRMTELDTLKQAAGIAQMVRGKTGENTAKKIMGLRYKSLRPCTYDKQPITIYTNTGSITLSSRRWVELARTWQKNK